MENWGIGGLLLQMLSCGGRYPNQDDVLSVFPLKELMNQPEHSPRKAAIAFVLLVLFIDILGIGIVIPVLPELVKELIGDRADEAASTSIAGWYFGVIGASYALMLFLFSPIIGSLSDRFGRRPVLLISMFGLGVDYLIQGMATSLTWLFIGRIVAGMMGASLTTGKAYIADISSDENRARNFGMIGATFGLGFTIGPALGGFLGGYDLRLPFFVAAGLALLNGCYGLFVLPESLPAEKRSTAFSLAGSNPFKAIGFLRKAPLVGSLVIVFVLTSFAQRGLENVWVLYTGFKFDWDAGTNGYALGLVGVMAIVVQGGLVRPIVARIGERKTAVFGTTVSAIAFLGYGLVPEGWMIPIVIVFGSLSGLAGPALQSLVTSAFDDHEQGRVQGALTSLMSLTNIAAPLFFNTLIFSYFTKPDAMIQIPGAPLIVGACLIAVAAVVLMKVFVKHQPSP